MSRFQHFFYASCIVLWTACDEGPGGGKDHTGDSGTPVSQQDADDDGYTADEDCDDNDASIHPGATELCDGLDNDCDGVIDEDVKSTFYADVDGDGFGDPEASIEACEKPEGYVPNGSDCDDEAAGVYPGATEVCDGLDNDCDGDTDEDLAEVFYSDNDGDGYGDPDSAVEACEQPAGTVTNGDDCDDTSDEAYPGGTEVCDELDNDCDGEVDEGVTTTYYADYDGDSYGDAAYPTEACAPPTGYVENATDCDDSNAEVHPDAIELCNKIDDDCDGEIDEDLSKDAYTWYMDYDGDGFGNSVVTKNE